MARIDGCSRLRKAPIGASVSLSALVLAVFTVAPARACSMIGGWQAPTNYERVDQGWEVGGAAFSRVNEEVDGSNSPWVQAVRLYLKVAALDNYDQEKAALRRLRARAAAGSDPRTYPPPLAGDIDRHFRTPTAGKSADDLTALFNQAPSDAVRLACLWALANSAPPAARDFLHRLLVGEPRKGWLAPLGRYFSAVEDRAGFAPLAAIFAHLAPADGERFELAGALVKAAAPKDGRRMLELLRGAADPEADQLALWFAARGADPRPAIADLDRRARGHYAEKQQITFALASLRNALRSVDHEDRGMADQLLAQVPAESAPAPHR